MNRIIYTQADGTVAIVIPANSVEEALKDIPEGVAYEVVPMEDVPSDRTFRNAWKHDTSPKPHKIGVDEVLAQGISLERVRAKRDEELKQLDVEYAIAARTGASTADLDVKRQKLLDATEALKALDVNNDGFISPEEAAGKFLPLEDLEAI